MEGDPRRGESPRLPRQPPPIDAGLGAGLLLHLLSTVRRGQRPLRTHRASDGDGSGVRPDRLRPAQDPAQNLVGGRDGGVRGQTGGPALPPSPSAAPLPCAGRGGGEKSGGGRGGTPLRAPPPRSVPAPPAQILGRIL